LESIKLCRQLDGNMTTINPSDNTNIQYNLIVGAANNLTGNIAPATSGTILQSAGASANPAYSTATYPATTTANQILYSSASNTVAGLATANNATLATNGSGVPSLVASKSVGAWVWLDSQVASTSSTIALSGVSATYNNYVLVYSQVTFSTTISMGVQINTGGGFIASGYLAGQNVIHYNAATLTNVSLTTSLMFANAATSNFIGGICYLNNLTSGNGYVGFTSQGIRSSGANADYLLGQGVYATTGTIVTAIQIIASTGTINTGKFTLYGIVE
jgi:hypothetical protein